jgi:SH3-like domain-containing protein
MTARHRHAFPFAVALVFALLFAAVPAMAQQMLSVDRNEINMRAGPGTDHESLWLLGRGYPLQVIGRKGKWVQVRDFEADKGWVYRPLLDKTRHFVVKVKVANIRSRPSTRGAILGKALYGDVLRTLERTKNWVKVQQEGGKKGWIARRLLWGW